MTRPDDIPQDVWDVALKALFEDKVDGALFTDNYVVPVARALMAAWNAGYLAGFNASGEGWNGEYPFEGKDPTQNDHWLEARAANHNFPRIKHMGEVK